MTICLVRYSVQKLHLVIVSCFIVVMSTSNTYLRTCAKVGKKERKGARHTRQRKTYSSARVEDKKWSIKNGGFRLARMPNVKWRFLYSAFIYTSWKCKEGRTTMEIEWVYGVSLRIFFKTIKLVVMADPSWTSVNINADTNITKLIGKSTLMLRFVDENSQNVFLHVMNILLFIEELMLEM